jgi:uncharacterized protein YjbI with pentapeptide repeats
MTSTGWPSTLLRIVSPSGTYSRSSSRSPDTEWSIRRLPLERRDLSGLRFDGMNMSGVSFRGANLDSSTFQSCVLTSAVLADAVIKGTKFTACTGLDRVDFGDLSTLLLGRGGQRPHR